MKNRRLTLIALCGVLVGGGAAALIAVAQNEGNSAQQAQYEQQGRPSTQPGSSQPSGGQQDVALSRILSGSPSFVDSSFFAAPSGPSTARRRRYGSRVRFRLRAPARVRFTVERRRRKCPRRRRKCKRYVKVRGSFTIDGKAGLNTFVFRGRIGGKTLKPGRYRLVATPIRGTQKGPSKRRPFRILKP